MTGRFLNSASGDKDDLEKVVMDPEDAKIRFRSSAAQLDKEFGLEKPFSAWGTLFTLLSTGVSVMRSRSWLLPLVGGVMGLGGKIAALLFGLFKPKEKKKQTPLRKKKKQSS